MGRLYVGAPIWSFRGWVGNLFPPKTKSQDYLKEYAKIFNTVEGNSTFYAFPSKASVTRWSEDVPDDFRFCFKFPRSISHDKALVNADQETETFLERMRPLQANLGPFFIQLGPRFSAKRTDDLARYLERLPRDFCYAVEVRHKDWFDEGPHEHNLHQLLAEHAVERALFDSRPLFASTLTDPHTQAAKKRKPRVPVRHHVVDSRAFVRFVGQNDVNATSGWLDTWAAQVVEWLDKGHDIYFFTHAPDDYFAPRLGRAFHVLVARHGGEIPQHPEWPGERAEAETPVQLSLLD